MTCLLVIFVGSYAFDFDGLFIVACGSVSLVKSLASAKSMVIAAMQCDAM